MYTCLKCRTTFATVSDCEDDVCCISCGSKNVYKWVEITEDGIPSEVNKYIRTGISTYEIIKITDQDYIKSVVETALNHMGTENYFYRSCWLCNPAHIHLIKQTFDEPLVCFSCGRVFFEGIEVVGKGSNSNEVTPSVEVKEVDVSHRESRNISPYIVLKTDKGK